MNYYEFWEAADFLEEMSLFLTIGLAQKPIRRMYRTKTKIRHIPVLNEWVASLRRLTNKGPAAPPTMAVHKIPAKEPWWRVTELRAREKIIGYIRLMAKPTQGRQ